MMKPRTVASTAPETIDIENCSHCGKPHRQLKLKAFARPQTDSTGAIWTHWGTCPNTGDPILAKEKVTP